MGYGSTAIDETPTRALLEIIRVELSKRESANAHCRCAYCNQHLNTHTCKFAASEDVDGLFHDVDCQQVLAALSPGMPANPLSPWIGQTFPAGRPISDEVIQGLPQAVEAGDSIGPGFAKVLLDAISSRSNINPSPSIGQAITTPGRSITDLLSTPRGADNVHAVILDVAHELDRARAQHAPMNSAHEAYAMILEEVDEFWEEVMKRRQIRSKVQMRLELIQIAAMACRAVIDLGLDRPANARSDGAITGIAGVNPKVEPGQG